MTTDGTPSMPQKSWFARNWYWLLAVGCLPILCCGLIGGGITMFAASAAKSSGAFVESVAIAGADENVIAAIGKPISPGFPKQTNVNIVNGVENVDLLVPISGPKGEGLLKVVAQKKGDGAWNYSQLNFEVNGKTIELNSGTKLIPGANDQNDVPLDMPVEDMPETDD
jgi:Cytochrome oxidase complex assembly protein 1